jgi:nucleotidyltransferase/DNA polymerase involved in DNA repair
MTPAGGEPICRHCGKQAKLTGCLPAFRADRSRKSVGAENTFPADLLTYEAARDALREIAGKVWGYCEDSGMRGRTVTLKVKFANFQVITRSRTGLMQVRTAMVGRNGSIDWLALPRFDWAACFAALLGGPENRRWQIA